MKKNKFLVWIIGLICFVFLCTPIFSVFSSIEVSAEEASSIDLHNITKIYRENEVVGQEVERQSAYANQTAKITVLTPGYGGNPYTFSNIGGEVFAYNEDSIIAALAEKTAANGGIDLYYAKCDVGGNDFSLSKLVGSNYAVASQETGLIDDASKHIVLIIESALGNAGHNAVYDEFHNVLDTISMHYKALTGLLPIYNLVGHSRGGIINLMYTTEHPYNVDKVFSVGTPYRGSRLGMVDAILDFVGMLNSNGKTQGVVDILSETTPIQAVNSTEIPTCNVDLRNEWNAVYAQGVRASITSIGTMMDLSAVSAILNDSRVAGYVNADMVSILNKVITTADDLQGLTEWLLNFVDGLANVLQVFGINSIDDLGFEENEWTTVDIEIYRKILQLVKNINGNLVIADDLFIDTDSQLGQGFADGGSYNGFSRMVKILTATDISTQCSSPYAPPVGHNIETMNNDIVEFISNALVCGNSANSAQLLGEEFVGNYTTTQIIRYMPAYTGERTISMNSGAISLYHSVDGHLQNCSIDGSNIEKMTTAFSYDFIAGESYWFLLEPNGIQNMQFQFNMTNNIALGNNTLTYNGNLEQSFKLAFEDNYFYNLSCEIEGAVFNTYDTSWNLIDSGIEEISIENGNNNKILVVLILPQSYTGDVTVACSKSKKILFTDNKHSKNVAPMIVENDNCSDLPTLEEMGYIFNGWVDSNGNSVSKEDVATINQATIQLYSQWTAISYTINYVTNGSDPISNESYTIEDVVALPNQLTYSGHIFIGWYEETDFSGTKVTSLSGETGNKTFYAQWALSTYILDDFIVDMSDIDNQSYTCSNGQAMGGLSISVNYGEMFTLPTLETIGFSFDGWYHGDIKITDENGESYLPYTYVGIMPLTARWIRESIKFKLVGEDGKQFWLANNQLTTFVQSIEYAAELSPNDMLQALLISPDATIRQQTFDYLYEEGKIYKCLTVDEEGTIIAGGQIGHYLNENNEITLYIKYDDEKYTIYFDYLGVSESCQIKYGEVIPYPNYSAYQNRYTIDGWYKDNFTVKYEKITIPDLTENEEGNGSLYLKLKANPIVFSISWVIPDTTIEGNSIDLTLYQLSSKTLEYTCEDSVSMVTMESDAYQIEGWYTDSTYTSSSKISSIPVGSYGNKTYYAKIEMREYTITFNSNGGSSCSAIIADYGEYITLPISTRTNYKGTWDSWTCDGKFFESNFDTEYQVLGNKTFVAQWKRYYTIEYKYLTFQGQEAELTWDDYFLYSTTRDYYFAGYEFELNRVGAFWQTSTPYTSQLRFLGWCIDSNLTTMWNNIPSTQTGTVTLYAKWRYDYDNPSRSGTYTITDSGRFNQSYDQCYIPLSSYNDLVGIGMQYLAITLKINMWEVNDGYQHIFLYDGSGSDANLLWSCDIEHGSTSAGVHTFQIYVPISQLQNVQYLYIRYGASGNFNDTWKNDKIYYEMMYVADKDDIDSPEFYWSYQDPFD